MSEEENKDLENQKKEDSDGTDEELNEDLKETFPASDPPSHTQPGHERDKKDDK